MVFDCGLPCGIQNPPCFQGFQLQVVCGLEKDHELVLERMQALRIMRRWIEVYLRVFCVCLHSFFHHSSILLCDICYRLLASLGVCSWWSAGCPFHSLSNGSFAGGCGLHQRRWRQTSVFGDSARAVGEESGSSCTSQW